MIQSIQVNFCKFEFCKYLHYQVILLVGQMPFSDTPCKALQPTKSLAPEEIILDPKIISEDFSQSELSKLHHSQLLISTMLSKAKMKLISWGIQRTFYCSE